MYHLLKSLYLYATSKEEYSILLLGLDNAGKTTLLNQIKSIFSAVAPSAKSTDVGHTVPTIGQNVTTISLPDFYLKFWDIGGQMKLRNLWQSYYASCHAIIFVVDSSDVGEDPDLERLPGYRSRKSSAATTESSPVARPEDKATTRESDDMAAETRNDESRQSFSTQDMYGRLDECREVLESVLQHSDTAAVPILVLANKQDREDSAEVLKIKEGFVRKVFEGEEGGEIRDSRVLPVSALMGTGVKEAVEWISNRVKWNKDGRPPLMR